MNQIKRPPTDLLEELQQEFLDLAEQIKAQGATEDGPTTETEQFVTNILKQHGKGFRKHANTPEIPFPEKRKLGGGGLSLKRRQMIKRLAAEGVPIPQIAKRGKCSVATVYRHLPKNGQE